MKIETENKILKNLATVGLVSAAVVVDVADGALLVGVNVVSSTAKCVIDTTNDLHDFLNDSVTQQINEIKEFRKWCDETL